MNNKYVKLEDVCSMLENAQIISDGEYSGYCTEDICLDSLPIADVVEVKYGEWIVNDFEVNLNSIGNIIYQSMDPLNFRCSLCGRIERHPEPYCNCGAKMNRKEE